LKADLLLGTFVLVLCSINAIEESRSNADNVIVARVVGVEESILPYSARRSATAVQVNVFKRMTELIETEEDVMQPSPLDDNHLRHVPEVVQMPEICSISSDDIINLAFVLTMEWSLKDSCNLFACDMPRAAEG
jgi:hypothetical protein